MYGFLTFQRKKENATCLVAYATNEGDLYTINTADAKMIWKLSTTEFGYAIIIIFNVTIFWKFLFKVLDCCLCSEIAALSFTNKGRKLCLVGTGGTLCEMNSETGEILKELKVSKKYVSTLVNIFGECLKYDGFKNYQTF